MKTSLTRLRKNYGGNDLSKFNIGWTEQHTQLWYDFLKEKNIKGISKDTWAMARPLFFYLFFFLFINPVGVDLMNCDG